MPTEGDGPAAGNGRSEFEIAVLEDRLDFVLDRIDDNLETFRDSFPSSDTGPDLTYDAWPAEDWTPSFWTGMCWLAYDLTGEEAFREVASGHLGHYEDRLTGDLEVDESSFGGHVQGLLTHDLGFVYTLSAVAQYRRTSESRAREAALRGAAFLADRYHENPGIIQAWGDHTDPDADRYGQTIIDCLMNLPLLFWAGEEIDYDRYREIAATHARQTATHFVRDDGSVYHGFAFDVESGDPLSYRPVAAYDAETVWARGQAWAIYGFALAYRYTGEEAFLDTSRETSAYYLQNLPDDYVPRWDFEAPADHMRDTSAGAIAACGLFELASHLPPAHPDRRRYEDAAMSALASLGDGYTTAGRDSNAVLTESWYGSADPVDQPENATVWGDYFYLEGLARATTDWTPYW